MAYSPFITEPAKVIEKHLDPTGDKKENYWHVQKIKLPNFCPFEEIPSGFSEVYTGTVENLSATGYYNDPIIIYHFPVFYQCNSCHRFICLDYVFGDPNETFTEIVDYNYDFQHFEYEFSKVIEETSPRFKQIYLQAQYAESRNLHEIDRIGYRKALEFLVKDYLKAYKNETDESIGNLDLAKCIRKLGSNELQDTAMVAAWIGNDGTHYLPRNPDLTIENLKEYLDSVVAFITYKIHAASAKSYRQSNIKHP